MVTPPPARPATAIGPRPSMLIVREGVNFNYITIPSPRGVAGMVLGEEEEADVFVYGTLCPCLCHPLGT